MSRKEWAGVLAACASSALGGTAVVATRAVVGQIDPLTLAALRYLIGAACLLPLALARGGGRPARADRPAVAGLGLLFFALFPYLFTLSLSMTTAARGSLALSTLPVLTLTVAALLGAERLTGGKTAGVLVALAGVALALSGRMAGMPEGAWRGDVVMVAAAMVGALYNVRSRPYLAHYPAVVFTAWAMAAGAAALVALAAARGTLASVAGFGWQAWAASGYLGAVGAALTFWLWSKGLERTTPTRVAITVTVNPISSMTLGALLLGEPVTVRLVAGLLAVVGGIWLATRERRA